MSNLSELLPAGAGAKSADFVASGTLASGQAIALKSDGTIEVITSDAIQNQVGSPTTFNGNTVWLGSTYDPVNNKIIIAYRDNTNGGYGTAIVGTVSGTSISFGPSVVFASFTVDYVSATYDSSNDKVVIICRASVVVGTVSGTSISFGSPVTFPDTGGVDYSITFDSNSNKVVAAYRNLSNSQYGTARVGTVSGTSISFGSATVFASSTTSGISTTFDSNSNKVVVSCYSGPSNYGSAFVGTVSGTSISFGSVVYFISAVAAPTSLVFDSSNNKVVLSYVDYGNSRYGTARVGTVSGTSISFGTAVVFQSNIVSYIGSSYDSVNNKTVVSYKNNDNSGYGTLAVGTVSGTSISFDTPIVFEDSASADQITSTFDSSAGSVITSYGTNYTGGASTSGKSVGFAVSLSNNTDFIGITDQAIADTATGAVIVQGGVSEKVSSLTTGSDYYVQADGSLSTTVSSVPAGRALSTTSILLEG